MFEKLAVKLTGVCPLLMHNGHLADPLNEFSKRLKEVSSKRKKTDADHMKMSEIEFFGSLYMDGDEYILPGTLFEAMLAKKSHAVLKIARAATSAGVMVEHPFILTSFTGPKDAKKRFKDKNCVDRRIVRVGNARVARTRAKFKNWEAIGEVSYDEDVFNKKDLLRLIEVCGASQGLGDYIPKFGRFDVEEI